MPASPEAAAQLANAVGTSFARVTPTLELSPQGGQSPVKITTVAVAVPPLAPSSPKLKLNLALGLFVGPPPRDRLGDRQRTDRYSPQVP